MDQENRIVKYNQHKPIALNVMDQEKPITQNVPLLKKYYYIGPRPDGKQYYYRLPFVSSFKGYDATKPVDNPFKIFFQTNHMH